MNAGETWERRKLNELGFLGRGRSRHRPRNEPSLYGGEFPFFQTGDIKEAELYLRAYSQTYNEKGLAQSKLWQPGTLCITIAANIAETAILGLEGCFPDSVVGFIADPDKADVRFVKYYIEHIKLQMQNISRGTTQDNLSLDKLLTFDVLTPPLPTQRRIADILSAYDDLIENNTRRIQILEEMAQTIYREWFVNFRFPGHENVEMVESEMGIIPEGWAVTQVKDIVKRIAAGKTYTGNDVMDSGRVPVVDQSRSEYLGFHNDQPDLQASALAPVLVFGDHTCKLGLMVQPFSIGPNVVPFVGMNGIPTQYLRYLADGLVQTREYKRHWTEFVIKRVVVAPNDLRTSFSEIVTPMLVTMNMLMTKNLVLRRTRDLLLPKLVSGEVDLTVLASDKGALS